MPLDYSLAFAENEKDNPWGPLHVERGYKAEENTVTLFCTTGFITGDSGWFTDPKDGIRVISKKLRALRATGLYAPDSGAVVLFSALQAKLFKEYSKADLKEAFWRESHRTVLDWKQSGFYEADTKAHVWPDSYTDLPPEASVPMWKSPKDIQILVAGGSTWQYYYLFDFNQPSWGTTTSVDKWR
jgi:hypothetical protein